MVLRVLVGIVFYTLLGVALWWFISPGTTTHRKDFALLMAQIAGGAALLFGLYFTWRRVEISQRTLETQQDQQVTERFTRAIDQLGATDDQGKRKLEIRLGGIYALERIARDSPERDYMTVMEVLTAYIRENAPWDKAPGPPPTQKPPLPADIQGILRVLARREESRVPKEYRVPLDLQKTNLSGVELRSVNLKRANLSAANLSAADLLGTDLEGAELWDADLHHANLKRANLDGADLKGANLEGADLDGANLKGAVFGFGSYPPGELGEANLEGADLSEANLEGAFLKHVNLKGASLYKADLKGADLNKARELSPGQLEEANGDEYTQLPDHLEDQRPAHWSKGGEEAAGEDEGGEKR